MNKSETKALKWLEGQGLHVYYQGRKNPAFITDEGKGYEVKLARGQKIWFTAHQMEQLKNFAGPLQVLIYEKDSLEPTVHDFDDVYNGQIHPYRVILQPKWGDRVDIVLPHELRAAVVDKMEQEGRSMAKVVRALLACWLAGEFDPWAKKGEPEEEVEFLEEGKEEESW